MRHIDGYARILKEECTEELSEGARRYLGQILEAVTHMGHLVDDLLNLAHIGDEIWSARGPTSDAVVRQTIADLPLRQTVVKSNGGSSRCQRWNAIPDC